MRHYAIMTIGKIVDKTEATNISSQCHLPPTPYFKPSNSYKLEPCRSRRSLFQKLFSKCDED